MGGDGLVGELLACFGVFERGFVTGHGGSERAPADAVTRLIETAERAAEAGDAGKKICFGDGTVGHGQTRSDGSAQGPFAVYVPGFEAARAFCDEEAADLVVFRFGPDDGYVSEGAVGDPHFFAVEDVLVSFFHGASEHAAWVGAELRFGEAEAADGLAGLQKGQPMVFLR